MNKFIILTSYTGTKQAVLISEIVTFGECIGYDDRNSNMCLVHTNQTQWFKENFEEICSKIQYSATHSTI